MSSTKQDRGVVFVSGSVRLSAGTYRCDIVCEGRLIVDGDIQAGALTADHVEVGPHRVLCDVLTARQSLHAHPESTIEGSVDAWGAIATAIEHAYAADDFPSAVAELTRLLRERDTEALRNQLPSLWNGLLTFHLTRQQPPNPSVCSVVRDLAGRLGAMT